MGMTILTSTTKSLQPQQHTNHQDDVHCNDDEYISVKPGKRTDHSDRKGTQYGMYLPTIQYELA
jgi:hypothetical protein